MPDTFSDSNHLRKKQYRDASNLEQRVSLHESYSTNPRPWHEWIFEQLALPTSARILEVGCGPGLLWSTNRERLGAGWRITLSDLSEGMVRAARDALSLIPLDSFVCLDVQDLPFAPRRFEAVIANHMLYHARAVADALSCITRVLTPDGKLYAATNGEAHLWELAELVRQAAGRRVSEGENALQRSVSNFSLQSGYDQLKRFFGEVEVLRYPDSLRVTDTEAIVQYVTSSAVIRLSEDGLARLRELVSERIEDEGAVDIRKEVGVFIASAPRGGM